MYNIVSDITHYRVIRDTYEEVYNSSISDHAYRENYEII
jgi:hypothetical protein